LRRLSVLGFAWFLGVSIELSPAGLLTGIAGDLHVSVAAVGTLTTLFALGNVLFVLPSTALSLRFTRRAAIEAAMALFVLSDLTVALAPSVLIADIGRFAGGAAYGMVCALFPSVAVHIAGRRFSAKAMTFIFTATTMGMVLGAPLASLGGAAFGWRVTFVGAAALSLVAGVLLWFAVPHIRTQRGHGVPLLQALRIPALLGVCVAWALLMIGHFTVLTYIDAYLKHVGAPEFVTGISLALLGVGGVVGVLAFGQVLKRSVVAGLLAGPVCVLIPFAMFALSGGALAVDLVAIAVWGAGFCGTVVAYQHAILVVGRRAPETATSIGVLLAQSGFAIGANAGGVAVDLLGIAAIPLVAAVFVLGAIALAATLGRTVRTAERGVGPGR
jgi:predicted MFS family arabinose efflux permease